jgi:hypothetical protein
MKFDMERFALKVEGKELYQDAISDRFAALENVGDDINRVWETIRENIKISARGSVGC